jgi:hypothetical protein
MKKIIAISFVVLTALAVLSLAACEPKGPKVVATETTFNFGQIDQFDQASHAFIIKNEGDQRLEIKRVKSSCGCTAAQPKSKVIEPGQQTEIEVTFNAGPRSGDQKKKITVETNDPANPRIELYMEGTVIERLVLDPRSIRILDAEPGKEATGTATVTNKSQEVITISELKFDDANIVRAQLKLEDKPVALPYKLEAGQAVTLSVTVKMPTDKNFYRAALSIVTAERPDKPVTVNIVLRKKGAGIQPGLTGQKIKSLMRSGPAMVAPGLKPKPKKKNVHH